MAEHFLNCYDNIINLKEHGEATETTEASVPSSLPAVKTAFNIPLVRAIFLFKVVFLEGCIDA